MNTQSTWINMANSNVDYLKTICVLSLITTMYWLSCMSTNWQINTQGPKYSIDWDTDLLGKRLHRSVLYLHLIDRNKKDCSIFLTMTVYCNYLVRNYVEIKWEEGYPLKSRSYYPSIVVDRKALWIADEYCFISLRLIAL